MLVFFISTNICWILTKDQLLIPKNTLENKTDDDPTLWGSHSSEGDKINIYCASSYTYTVHNSAIGICEIKKPSNFNEIFKNVSAEIISAEINDKY